MYLNIFQIFLERRRDSSFFFFLPPLCILSICLYIFPRSTSIVCRGCFLSVLSPKFYRVRISIVISLFGIHFPIFLRVSRSVTSPFSLSRSRFRLIYLSSLFVLFLLRAFLYLRFYLSYRSDSTHSRVVSYSWPPWQ